MFDSLDQLTDRDYALLHSEAYNRAFRAWLKNPNSGAASALIGVGDTRAMGISQPSAGGYLAPESFSREFWKRMTQTSVMRAVSTVAEASGQDAAIPYVDDSSNRGEILAENTAASETDLLVSLKRLPSYLFSSDILRVSFQLQQDAGPEALEQFLLDSLTERVARNLNLHATTGAGANQPQGIATAVTVGVSGAVGQTTTVTWNDLEDLVASVPEAYVWGKDGLSPQGAFMMAGATFQAVRKLTDGNGHPLWHPDPTGKSPGVLCGFKVAINSDMPSMAASAKPIVFGWLGSYVIRDSAVIVKNLVERYAESGQVAFLVYSRHGAGLIDPTGVRAYQNSAT